MSFLKKRVPAQPQTQSPLQLAETFASNLMQQAAMRDTWMYLGERLTPALGQGVCELYQAHPLPHYRYLAQRVATECRGRRLLDFGCGNAPHKPVLEETGFDWRGLDYAASQDPAALERAGRTFDGRLSLYAGTDMPFEDGRFDVVWAWQSFEHVQNLERSFSEVARVLSQGGIFTGSLSFLEPFHAHSTFNYSPYGMKLLAERNGLTLRTILPTNDGLSLVLRTYLSMLGFDEVEYPWPSLMEGGGIFYKALVDAAMARGRESDLADGLASICGQFLFIVRKD